MGNKLAMTLHTQDVVTFVSGSAFRLHPQASWV